MLERFAAQMVATARRYSANVQDAEDAYQRAAEILLTRDPSGTDDELCRWLRTTVKHEALAIRRHRERVLPLGQSDRVPEPPAGQPDTHERAERFERLRLGAQALGRLKPAEVRCLVLRAEGYTYKEICERTGYSYTKVDRCLKEGRRAFVARMAGIESGAECERMAPLLSGLADGEAGPEDLALLRPHLRSCLACRSLLREYRAVPSRVAALVPPAALVASSGSGSLRTLVESVVGATQDRAASVGERAHQAAEMATAQKMAAAASAVALAAGGGAGVERLSSASSIAPPIADAAPARQKEAGKEVAPSPPPPPSSASPTPAPTAPAPARTQPPPSPKQRPTNEFAPEATAASPAAAPAPAPAPRSEFTPGGGGGGGSGGGEFGP